MSFTEHCTDASAALLALSTRIENLEIQLLRLDENRNDTNLLTVIVTRLFEAKDLSEELLHVVIPAIGVEEPAVALAVRIAHQELMRRYWGVRDDFEVMTKVKDRKPRSADKVVHLSLVRTLTTLASTARASSRSGH